MRLGGGCRLILLRCHRWWGTLLRTPQRAEAMNPYESGNELVEVPAAKFRLGRVIIAGVVAAVLLFSCYVSYEIGYAHGYEDGNTDRMTAAWSVAMRD